MNLPNVSELAPSSSTMFAPSPTTIPFDLNAPQEFQAFVAKMRNELADPKRTVHGLPIVKQPNPKGPFFYIRLDAAAHGREPKMSVTLQLQTLDYYVVAYRDIDNTKKDRVFYFEDLIKPEQAFPDEKKINRRPMKCSHLYASIEHAAGIEIKDLEFRLPNLEDAMRKAYGMADAGNFGRMQAVFVLYSIQMTSEAARFIYIEKKTVNQLHSDVEVASLVTVWNKLSEQIVWSSTTDGKFITPIVIDVAPGKTLKIERVDQIKPDMGILSYVKPKAMVDCPVEVDDDDDDDEEL